MAEEQLLLLPRDRYYDWVAAARDYILNYGVNVTPEPATAARATVVTAPNGPSLFAVDLSAWFRQNAPQVRLDLVPATRPDELAAELQSRLESDDRYGELKKEFKLLWPTDYNQITQAFGINPDIYRRYGLPGHEGLDIRAPMGTNIYACADGTVVEVGDLSRNHPYGIFIRLDHRDGYQTTYAHLQEALVRLGDQVKARQVIGKADSTGNSSSSHLHLTLKKKGATAAGLTNFPRDIIDPTPFMVRPTDLTAAPGGAASIDYKWPPGKCLVGLHTRADGPMMPPDLEAARLARVEAVKLMTTSRPENIDQLRQINPDMFILVRMHADFRNRVVRSDEFARWMEGDMQPFYEKGIRYFEVHNEPNLTTEGWKASWQDGREFGAWFLDVIGRLRARFPEAKFGYPGLSPGDNISGLRMNSNAFMSGSDDAIRRADWVGVHCYWVDEASMLMDVAGKSWMEVRRRYPDKLLFITEFSNPNEGQDTAAKGQQYVRYYEMMRNEPGFGAAFSFVCSASSGFTNEVWRWEEGRLTDIPRAVSRRSF